MLFTLFNRVKGGIIAAALYLTLNSEAVMTETAEDLKTVKASATAETVGSFKNEVNRLENKTWGNENDHFHLVSHARWDRYDLLPFRPVAGTLSVLFDHDNDGKPETYIPFHTEQGSLVLLSLAKAAEVREAAINVRSTYGKSGQLASQALAVKVFVEKSTRSDGFYIDKLPDGVEIIYSDENEPLASFAPEFNDVASEVSKTPSPIMPPPQRKVEVLNVDLLQISKERFKLLLVKMSPPEGADPIDVNFAFETVLHQLNEYAGGQTGFKKKRFSGEQLDKIKGVWKDYIDYSALLEEAFITYNDPDVVLSVGEQGGLLGRSRDIRDSHNVPKVSSDEALAPTYILSGKTNMEKHDEVLKELDVLSADDIKEQLLKNNPKLKDTLSDDEMVHAIESLKEGDKLIHDNVDEMYRIDHDKLPKQGL